MGYFKSQLGGADAIPPSSSLQRRPSHTRHRDVLAAR